LVRMVPRVPHHMDRIKALGNAVVPQVGEYIGRRILEYASHTG
jgi:site-specific DNA-cytosine methylase